MHAKTWLMKNDRWIPTLIVVCFLVIIAVNGTMVWYALSTWTGLTTDKAYVEGVHYNDTLSEEAATAALDWNVDVDVAANADGQVAQLTVNGPDGGPVDGATILGRFVRPTHEGYDFDVAFRQIGAGRYLAQFVAPLAGQWDLRFEIDRGGDVYRDARRVIIKP